MPSGRVGKSSNGLTAGIWKRKADNMFVARARRSVSFAITGSW